MPAEPLPASDPCLDVAASVERILQTAMGEAETILSKARAEAATIREAAVGERARAAEEAAVVRQRAQDECEALVAQAQNDADAIVQQGKEELARLEAARASLCQQLNEIETAARALRATMSGDGRSANGEKRLWVPATVRPLADLTGPDGNGHAPPPVRVLSP
jgi:cell division septum initiation protein DivIVA